MTNETRGDLDALAADVERVVGWALATYGERLAMSSSFQTQSLPLLHMVSRVAPRIPILFLDTGYHFPETLEFRERLAQGWGLNIVPLRGDKGAEFRSRSDQGPLYRTNPDLCCFINKVEPMRAAQKRYPAWISGIRRDQSAARADIRVVEEGDGQNVRIHPMAAWTAKDVTAYIDRHGLPRHPLAHTLPTIGCAPCTSVPIDEDARSGRWANSEKTECGLHTTLRTPASTDRKDEP